MESKSVLIVEDSFELIEQLEDYLSIYFDKVYSASDGKEGFASYLENKPDVIFTDINMPEFNGIELIKKIKKLDENIPIVIISAHTTNEYFVEAIDLGVVTYLIKPITSVDLKKGVRKVLDNLSYPSTSNTLINLNQHFFWNDTDLKLYNATNEILLSDYERLFIKALYDKANRCVSFIDLHISINIDVEYSKNSVTSLVKRIRQKTNKGFITTCYMQGYKLDLIWKEKDAK